MLITVRNLRYTRYCVRPTEEGLGQDIRLSGELNSDGLGHCLRSIWSVFFGWSLLLCSSRICGIQGCIQLPRLRWELQYCWHRSNSQIHNSIGFDFGWCAQDQILIWVGILSPRAKYALAHFQPNCPSNSMFHIFLKCFSWWCCSRRILHSWVHRIRKWGGPSCHSVCIFWPNPNPRCLQNRYSRCCQHWFLL